MPGEWVVGGIKWTKDIINGIEKNPSNLIAIGVLLGKSNKIVNKTAYVQSKNFTNGLYFHTNLISEIFCN